MPGSATDGTRMQRIAAHHGDFLLLGGAATLAAMYAHITGMATEIIVVAAATALIASLTSLALLEVRHRGV